MITGEMDLSAPETRVLGCLLEKQRTTPDTYPLTLNALRMACNQSTNRDPVVDYDDAIVRDALHRLERRGFVRLASGRGSRAPKYRHLLAEALPMNSSELAIMCVLLLRGAQTPGELNQRGERMHPFAGIEDVQQTLRGLMERELVVRMERRPGQKEERYAHLLSQPAAADAAHELVSASARSEPDHAGDTRSGFPVNSGPPPDGESLAGLHERVARLERELAQLRAGTGADGPAGGPAELPL
jgi:uncharacterized protein YceH (UPF0502 family)